MSDNYQFLDERNKKQRTVGKVSSNADLMHFDPHKEKDDELVRLYGWERSLITEYDRAGEQTVLKPILFEKPTTTLSSLRNKVYPYMSVDKLERFTFLDDDDFPTTKLLPRELVMLLCDKYKLVSYGEIDYSNLITIKELDRVIKEYNITFQDTRDDKERLQVRNNVVDTAISNVRGQGFDTDFVIKPDHTKTTEGTVANRYVIVFLSDDRRVVQKEVNMEVFNSYNRKFNSDAVQLKYMPTEKEFWDWFRECSIEIMKMKDATDYSSI